MVASHPSCLGMRAVIPPLVLQRHRPEQQEPRSYNSQFESRLSPQSCIFQRRVHWDPTEPEDQVPEPTSRSAMPKTELQPWSTPSVPMPPWRRCTHSNVTAPALPSYSCCCLFCCAPLAPSPDDAGYIQHGTRAVGKLMPSPLPRWWLWRGRRCANEDAELQGRRCIVGLSAPDVHSEGNGAGSLTRSVHVGSHCCGCILPAPPCQQHFAIGSALPFPPIISIFCCCSRVCLITRFALLAALILLAALRTGRATGGD
jgi:hypothetical protein